MSALPTPSFATFRDASAFASAAPRHVIRIPGGLLTPGEWIVGVANARPTPLPAFLRRDTLAGWGAAPGFAGATAPMAFTLRAALSPYDHQLCPADCSGHGACIAGQCICNAADAAAAPAPAAAPGDAALPAAAGGDHAGWAGPACEAVVVPIKSGYDTQGILRAGAFAHYWVRCHVARERRLHAHALCACALLHTSADAASLHLGAWQLPLDAATEFNADLLVELSYDQTPSVRI